MARRKFRTGAAAKFLAEIGEKYSPRTLQGYRLKGPDDPGEPGPKWYRDPITEECFYFSDDLLAWIDERNSRLVERSHVPQRKQLATA
jgi:hypothetical protein